MSSNSVCNHTRDKQIAARSSDFVITRMITDRIGLHLVLLLIIIIIIIIIIIMIEINYRAKLMVNHDCLEWFVFELWSPKSRFFELYTWL